MPERRKNKAKTESATNVNRRLQENVESAFIVMVVVVHFFSKFCAGVAD